MPTVPDPVDLTRALVRCPSVTPDAGAALDECEAALSAAGFSCTRLTFSDDDTPDVDNLFARIGTGAPHLAFSGHLDVVPPGDEAAWTYPPFSGKDEDGYLFGRGATDMKSGVAAFIAAAAAHLADNPGFSGSISFILTGDEEGPSINGTPKILNWMRQNNHAPDHCIVGEPASLEAVGDQIKVGRRGTISGRLTAIGRQGHVAYQHMADNAVTLLARMIAAIKAEPLDEGSDRFQPSNLEFTDIATANRAGNVIPGRAWTDFNIRYMPDQTPNRLKAILVRRIATVATRDQFDLALQAPSGEPFLTEDAGLIDTVRAAIGDVTGHDAALSTGGGTSDARYIKDLCPVVEVGLCSKTMHEVDERVPVADIETLFAVYRRLLERYFAG